MDRLHRLRALLKIVMRDKGFISPYFIQLIIFISFSSISLSGCHSSVGKNHYILAERLFVDHKYAAAVDEFKKIVENDPKGILAQQAIFRIAVIQYLYLGLYKDAVHSFMQFNSVSQNKDLVYQSEKYVADIYFSKLEEYKNALTQYLSLIDKYKDSKETEFFMLRVAKSYYGALDFAKAIDAYKTLIHKYPKGEWSSEANYQIGNTFFTKGDVDLAIQAYKNTLSAYPSSPQAIFAEFGIANCLEEKEQFDDALEIYERILQKHPAKNVVESKIKRLKEKKAKAF